MGNLKGGKGCGVGIGAGLGCGFGVGWGFGGAPLGILGTSIGGGLWSRRWSRYGGRGRAWLMVCSRRKCIRGGEETAKGDRIFEEAPTFQLCG